MERMLKAKLKLKGKLRGNIGAQVVKVPAFTSLFILSGTLHPSGFDGSLNLSLFLLITTFQWGYEVHICHVFFFRWQLPHLPCWCDQKSRAKRLNNCWGRFLSPSVRPSGCRGRMSRWVTTMCHICISHRVMLSSKPVAANMWYDSDLKRNNKKKTADILHSWAHSTKYNNFLEFFDPRRRSQGTSCCPRSTSCSCGSISLRRCHGHWKTLYSCLLGMLAGSAWTIVEQRSGRSLS